MKDYKTLNDNKRKFLNPMKPLHKGIIINTHNSLEHELKKAEIFYNCKKQGLEVFTEVGLKNTGHTGQRIADVIVLDTLVPIIYEIADSETEDSLDKKKADFNKLGIKMKTIRLTKSI